jgi:hypothetical protein
MGHVGNIMSTYDPFRDFPDIKSTIQKDDGSLPLLPPMSEVAAQGKNFPTACH